MFYEHLNIHEGIKNNNIKVTNCETVRIFDAMYKARKCNDHKVKKQAFVASIKRSFDIHELMML